MQQNQPLLKLNIGEVFYTRQIWQSCYNLTIMVHEENQGKDNTLLYTWTKNETGRGSNEICSTLISFFNLFRVSSNFDHC